MLVVLPVLAFALPAAIGHPAITGDNLIQNFPLRVLTGEQLRQGHLPLWNPFVWSGSPLLGGLNSGSFYPFTFLFAFVAPIGAWVLNLLSVYWAGGLGMYALARQYRLRPLASLLGALTYAFSGTMSGQIVHLGVIEGMGWMPLLVLAALRLSWAVLGTGPARAEEAGTATGAAPSARDGDRPARTSPWPWVALLAAMVGLEALTGEPRAIAETEIVASAVTAWLVLRPYARTRVAPGARARLFGLAVLGGVWGAALAAAELAPGWSFIQASQRAAETYQFFGSGSLRVGWSVLLLVPDLFGGAGLFGQVRYFNAYNLPEVTGYVGLLPIGGALVLLVRSFGRRRSRLASDWGMWLALGALGLLLAWGTFTPLGHVWVLIPLFGKTRLQSRNLEILDLALGVLFAFFADRLIAAGASSPRGGRLRYLAAAPAAGAFVLCALTLALPGPIEQGLHATAKGAAAARGLWPWFGAEMLVAAAVAALMVGWHRLGPVRRRRLLGAIVVVDIALFAMATSTAVAPPTATFEPTTAAAAAVLGTGGRFGIVDTAVSHLDTLSAIGQPDLNAFTHLPSVQGYGSIVSGGYEGATGTHTLDTMSPCALRRGVFGPLRLQTLVVYAGNLVQPAGPAPALTQAAGQRARARAQAHAAALAASCPNAPVPGTAARRTLYLGWPVDLVRATLVLAQPGAATEPVRVGVVGTDGRTTVPPQSVVATPAGWTVTFAYAVRGVGIVVEGPAHAISETSTVTAASGGRWALGGTFQDPLDTTAWRYAGTVDGAFALFTRTGPLRPPVWLVGTTAGSSVHQVSRSDWGTAVDQVAAVRPVTVVWSESYFPGWHATLSPMDPPSGPASGRGARARELVVTRHGLLQSVRVPAGHWTLTFHYTPRLFVPGVAGSLLALVGFGALGAVSVLGRRRTRRTRAPGHVAAGR